RQGVRVFFLVDGGSLIAACQLFTTTYNQRPTTRHPQPTIDRAYARKETDRDRAALAMGQLDEAAGLDDAARPHRLDGRRLRLHRHGPPAHGRPRPGRG